MSSGARTSWRLGLLGHPVAHSRSPALHRAALHAAGLRGRYELFDVLHEELHEHVDALRRGDVDGLNVTVPHKEAVVALCDRTVGAAEQLGAVNTLVRGADGAVEGHNTDVAGLAGALNAAWTVQPWVGGVACVVGAGGAARAAVLAATLVGAAEVRIVNRTRARAERMVAALGGGGRRLTASDDLRAGCDGAHLVLQATSLGMGATDGDPGWATVQAIAVPAFAGLVPGARLMDLIYTPRRTAWVAAADAAGIVAFDGMEMLIRQAAAAFQLWTSVPADIGAMRAAAG